MIIVAILGITVFMTAIVITGGAYLFHTRTEVEQTNRTQAVERTKQKAMDNAWIEHNNQNLALEIRRAELGLPAGSPTVPDHDKREAMFKLDDLGKRGVLSPEEVERQKRRIIDV